MRKSFSHEERKESMICIQEMAERDSIEAERLEKG